MEQAAQIEQLEAKNESNFQRAEHFESRLFNLEESLKNGTYRTPHLMSKETWDSMFSGHSTGPLIR